MSRDSVGSIATMRSQCTDRRSRRAYVSGVPVKAQRAIVGWQTMLSRAEGSSEPDALRGRV